jgi:hypothetical protein
LFSGLGVAATGFWCCSNRILVLQQQEKYSVSVNTEKTENCVAVTGVAATRF